MVSQRTQQQRQRRAAQLAGNRASEAATFIAEGDIQSAIDVLTSLLQKIEDQSPPPDWMDDADPPGAKAALAAEVQDLIALLQDLL